MRRANPQVNRHVLLLIGLMLTVGGCAGSKLQQSFTARQTFNAAMQESIVLRQSNKIDASTFAAIESVARNGAPLLDAADDAALSGNPFRWQSASSAVSNVIDELLAKIIVARKK